MAQGKPGEGMSLLFAHGKESGPWGSKITALARTAESLGYQVDSIDYQDLKDPDHRVQRLLDRLDSEAQPVVLVGSSMGGYVSLVAAQHSKVAGAFLLAPALYLKDYRQQDYPCLADRVCIVHGWQDDVVSPEVSIRYAQTSKATLHLITGDHRLNAVLNQVSGLFVDYLHRIATQKAKATEGPFL